MSKKKLVLSEETVMAMSEDEIWECPMIIKKVHNPDELPLIDYRTIPPIQELGENRLKDFHRKNIIKFKRGLLRRGFKRPFIRSILQNGEEYLDDGHGRRNIFSLFPPIDQDGNPIFLFPFQTNLVRDKKQAAEELLENNGTYQTMTQDGDRKSVV